MRHLTGAVFHAPTAQSAERDKLKREGIVTMTIEQRNMIFEEYMNIIRYTVNRHNSMLKVLRMDGEDLAQELAIYLLKAIERYKDDRGVKPSAYYFKALRYWVLKLWREQTMSLSTLSSNDTN